MEAGEPGEDGPLAASPVELEDTFRETEHVTIPILSTAAETALATESTLRTALHHTAVCITVSYICVYAYIYICKYIYIHIHIWAYMDKIIIFSVFRTSACFY